MANVEGSDGRAEDHPNPAAHASKVHASAHIRPAARLPNVGSVRSTGIPSKFSPAAKRGVTGPASVAPIVPGPARTTTKEGGVSAPQWPAVSWAGTQEPTPRGGGARPPPHPVPPPFPGSPPPLGAWGFPARAPPA